MSRAYLIDETAFVFDNEAFKSIFNRVAASSRTTKKQLMQTIAAKSNIADSTVEGWLKNKSTPSGLEVVESVANALKVDEHLLLKEKGITEEEPEKEKDKDKEDKNLRTGSIFAYETARTLYGEICDLLADAEYVEPRLEPVIGSWLHSDDRRRFAMLREVRRASFDLPKDLTDQLSEIINDIFGPNLDDPDGYFASEDYRDYLKTNGWADADEYRYLYSAVFVSKHYERLERLFSDYKRSWQEDL